MTRCQPHQFQKYLRDLRTIKLFLVDKRNIKCLGVVHVDVIPHLSKRGVGEDESPLESIHGAFPVMKPPTAIENKKERREIGLIEIQVGCKFGPEFENLAPKRNVFVECLGSQPKEPSPLPPHPSLSSPRPPERKLADHLRGHQSPKVDLSQLISRTNQLLEEMDLEVLRDADRIQKEAEIQKIERGLGIKPATEPKGHPHPIPDDRLASFQTPHRLLHNEVELEMVRAQKNLLRGNLSPTSRSDGLDTEKISEMFHQAAPIQLTYRFNFVRVEVEAAAFQKVLTDNISFLKIDLREEGNPGTESFK